MPAKPVTVLRRARDLISDPEHWTQHEISRKADGTPVSCLSPEAAKWCALGATARVVGDYGWTPADDYLTRALPRGYKEVSSYQDSRTHRTVLRLFDRAIELAVRNAS